MTKKTQLTVEEALAIIDDESTEWTLKAARTPDGTTLVNPTATTSDPPRP